jgi:2-methylcitrate dehydratase PrpD
MTLTSRLVQACLQTLPQRVDAAALRAARRCFIDSLAVAYAAHGERPIEMLRSLTTEGQASGEASVIGYGDRGRAGDAALVNGMMISLQLFDDNHELMRGHPSGPLLPAVLALGEAHGISLADALTAFVVGYEVECRLGVLLNPSHYEQGWHATATQGAVAAACASGLILKLDEHAMAHALGIVASLASGLRRNFGSMTMSMHSGVAASNGVRAAQLARLGFTADPAVFDRERSFGHMFSREWSDTAFEQDLPQWGAPWMLLAPGATFKLFPCGRPTLFGVDAALAIQGRHGIRAEDVARITCDVSYMYPRTLIHSRPVNGLQGKTSLEYCIAATLIDGRPTLASFTDEAVQRPLARQLVERTQVRVPSELSEDVPQVRKAPFEQPLTMTLETVDGRSFTEVIRHHKGSPQHPATDADLRDKFADCATPKIGSARVQEILATIEAGTAGVRDLMALLPVRR